MSISEKRMAQTATILIFLCLLVPNRCVAEEPKSEDWIATVSAAKCKYADKAWNEKYPDGFWQLEMTLEYCGKKSIEVSPDDLPWSWRYSHSKIILAISTRSNRPLSSALPVSDPSVFIRKSIKVEPKQVLKGTIVLGSYIEGLDKELESSSVIVFWTWKHDSSGRIGGWVEIPQTTSLPNHDKTPSTSKESKE
jgi:hypothetical protein